MKPREEGAERELFREERILTASFEAIPHGVIVLTENLTISHMNRKTTEILGLKYEPKRVLSLKDLPFEWYPAQLDSILQDVFDRKMSRTFCQRLQAADHKSRTVQLRLSPVVSGSNAVSAVVLEIRDSSSEFQLEKGKLRSEKLAELNTIAVAIAHEINGPLDGIMRLTRISLQSLDTANPIRAFLEEALEKQKAIAAIGKSLLDFAQRYSQEERQITSLCILAREVLDSYELKFRNKHIHVHLHVTDERIAVQRAGLHCILDTIINIALEWADKGATISLSTTDCGDNLIVEARVEPLDPIPLKSGTSPLSETSYPAHNLGIAKKVVEHYNGTIRTELNACKSGLILVNVPLEYIAEENTDWRICPPANPPFPS